MSVKGGMKMKKILILIVTGILLISFVSFVLAEMNGSANKSGNQDNVNTGTQNKANDTELQNTIKETNQVRSGNYVNSDGKQMQIQTQVNNEIKLKVGNAEAKTKMNMTQQQVQNKTKLMVKLSNGRNAEIKVMPDTASEKALERLRLKVCSSENNCSIELKEVGKREEVKAAYEVKIKKQSKFLGLIKTKMQVQAQVSAETGEVIRAKKPWWAFLATEPEE